MNSTELTKIGPEVPRLNRVTVPYSLLANLQSPTLDLARGTALVLLIIWHSLSALLSPQQLAASGLQSIEAFITYANSLLIFGFGFNLVTQFSPGKNLNQWPEKRRQLWWNSLELMFWYKILTLTLMLKGHSQKEIIDTLLFNNFPQHIMILYYFSLANLWLSLFFPLWIRSPAFLKLFWLLVVFGMKIYFSQNFLWSSQSLKVQFITTNGTFILGQISEAPVIFLGLAVGDMLMALRQRQWTAFRVLQNVGRFFSIVFSPFAFLGRYCLEVFVFHIAMVFIVFQWLLNYRSGVDTPTALYLTSILILLSFLWAGIHKWRNTPIVSRF